MHINILAARWERWNGYARMGMHLMRALTRIGVTVTPIHLGQLEMPAWVQRAANIGWDRLTISIVPWTNICAIPGRQWIYTMYETDALPQKVVAALNQNAERVLVPCQWNADVFKASGVSCPIHVVPLGIDPDETPLVLQAPDRPYTFMTLGDYGGRKGDDIVTHAFETEFRRPTDNVRLIIKARAKGYQEIDFAQSTDPLARCISKWREDVDAIADIYAHADCFVFPSRGEGWGMPPREAAAMGIPAIATRYGGLIDGIDDWGIPIDEFSLSPSPMGGQWAFPSIEAVRRLMRQCYEDRAAAKKRALCAAQWLREYQTWRQSAECLKAVIEEHGIYELDRQSTDTFARRLGLTQ